MLTTETKHMRIVLHLDPWVQIGNAVAHSKANRSHL
jgi:hypothetical protein